MLPKVYIETTIPSYLTSRTNRDLIIAAHQELTREWWDARRSNFELYVSQFVLQECEAGDPQMAEQRLDVLSGIEILPVSHSVIHLAEQLVNKGPLPAKAATDAVHIAVAASCGMDYLLTWNCKHIANAMMQEAIRELCIQAGFRPPEICTPEELMGD